MEEVTEGVVFEDIFFEVFLIFDGVVGYEEAVDIFGVSGEVADLFFFAVIFYDKDFWFCFEVVGDHIGEDFSHEARMHSALEGDLVGGIFGLFFMYRDMAVGVDYVLGGVVEFLEEGCLGFWGKFV